MILSSDTELSIPEIDLDIQECYHFLYDGSIEPYREIIIKGGRGGGKTKAMVMFFLYIVFKEGCRVICLREFANSNKNSLLNEFKEVIYNYHLDIKITNLMIDFLPKNQSAIKIQATSITFAGHRGEILFTGINDNTIMALKSIGNIKYAWLEEANFLTEYAYRILKPCIRMPNSKIFYTFNPQSSEDFLYQKSLNSSPRVLVKTINYDQNIYFKNTELEFDRQDDFKNLPRALYNHIWLGEPLEFNDMAVIPVERIGRFNDNEYHSYQTLILSIDTATSTKTGADFSVISSMGITQDGDFYMIHLTRGHFDWHTLMTKIIDVYHITNKITNQSPQYLLIEAKANGNNVIQELERTTSLCVIPITPITDKLSRVVNSFLPFIDKFKIPMNIDNPFNFWIKDYLNELTMFRADGKHDNDDMVDVTSQGLDFLSSNSIDFAKIAQTFSKFKRNNE